MAGRSNFKIVLLGEGRVGKTSLVIRYVNNTFSDKQQCTVQASFLTKRLKVGDNTTNLAIWDTAGQERFHALGPIYYRDADGALLVYDTTDAESFAKVKSWVKELRKMVGESIVICIAGNKIDLDRERQVEREEAEEYAKSVGAAHCLTSAKSGRGIDETFLTLTKGILEAKASSMHSTPQRQGAGTGSITVVQDGEREERDAPKQQCAC
uniref:Ras-related protein Rab-21 n=1 Tax=Hemiselmis andersenii TaxID=464988 RepID=A0A6U4HT06_HEMAN|mmetsp:Transcript_32809/g.76628  ORF Transcript_32809/g.76628 Transcript_32809/m.76628 type:complete len:210 (-) Transcript_32809:37-666(-)